MFVIVNSFNNELVEFLFILFYAYSVYCGLIDSVYHGLIDSVYCGWIDSVYCVRGDQFSIP